MTDRLEFAAQGPVSRSSRELPGPLSCFVSIKDGSFKSFENGTIKLWASFEVRTQHTFLENLISKYDHTGPVKLPGLSRNGPQLFY